MPDLKDDIRSLIEGGIRPLDLSEIPRPLSRDERVLKGGSVPLFQNTGIRRKLSHRFSKSRHGRPGDKPYHRFANYVPK